MSTIWAKHDQNPSGIVLCPKLTQGMSYVQIILSDKFTDYGVTDKLHATSEYMHSCSWNHEVWLSAWMVITLWTMSQAGAAHTDNAAMSGE